MQKYLKPFYIGELKETVEEGDYDGELKKEFEQLRQKAIARVRDLIFIETKLMYYF